ncbi:MAG TPA: hydrogenase maturation peptidase HycI [Clostridiales bacterium]|jgi:hydrogenase maturation protease HycI|nr:hydrogenase maturation peptidase HycI [Clostridiales bacterium]
MSLDCLKEKIKQAERIAIMGIGSELRSDDAAGMRLINELNCLGLSNCDNVRLLYGSTAPENFTGEIKAFSPNLLILVDAASMGLQAGAIKIIESDEIMGVTFSTHMLPLPIVLNYLKQEASFETVLIGIQPKSTDFGIEISEEVTNSVSELAIFLYDSIIATR